VSCCGKRPVAPEWAREIKLDGYRATAVRSGGAVALRRPLDLSDDLDGAMGMNCDGFRHAAHEEMIQAAPSVRA
jgi:hypothetical protein